MVEIKESKVHGKGVFATKYIKKGTQIDCDVILVNKNNLKKIEYFHNKLKDYVFPWDEKNFSFCIGFGSFLNHSDTPNLKLMYYDRLNLKNVFVAMENIFQGQELFLQYSHMHSVHQSNIEK